MRLKIFQLADQQIGQINKLVKKHTEIFRVFFVGNNIVKNGNLQNFTHLLAIILYKLYNIHRQIRNRQ